MQITINLKFRKMKLVLVYLGTSLILFSSLKSFSQQLDEMENKSDWKPEIIYLKNGKQDKGVVNVFSSKLSIDRDPSDGKSKFERIKDFDQIDSIVGNKYGKIKNIKGISVVGTVFYKPLVIKNKKQLLRRLYEGTKYDFYEILGPTTGRDINGGLVTGRALSKIVLTKPKGDRAILLIKERGDDKTILKKAKNIFYSCDAAEKALSNKDYKNANFNLFTVLDKCSIR